MSHATLDPLTVLHRRLSAQSRRGYYPTGLCKDLSSGLVGLTIDPGGLDFNDGQMSITGIISTESEDRSGDVVFTDGMDLSQHQEVPIVLYEHGLKDMLFPGIGLAQSPQGAYTVKKFHGYAVGTTYFHQSTKEAVQCYDLARRGILKGLSLGFKPIEFKTGPFTGYDQHGEPKHGLLLYKILVVEYTHCFLADNFECQTLLQETLAKKTANGEAISEVLYKSLLQHATPRKHLVQGATLEPSLSELMLKTMRFDNTPDTPDPLTEGGYVEMDNNPTPGSPTDLDQPGASEPTGETGSDPKEPGMELPGAMALKELHDKCLDYKSCVEGHMNRQENPAIRAHLDKHCEMADEMCKEHAKLHMKEYQDNPGYEELGSESPENESAPPQSSGYANDEAGNEMSEADYRKKAIELQLKRQGIRTKRLELYQKRQEEVIAKRLQKQAPKPLDEHLSGMLTKAIDHLNILSKVNQDAFTAGQNGTPGKEIYETFKLANTLHVKNLSDVVTKYMAAKSAPEQDELKTVKAELDGLKRKHLAVLEDNQKLLIAVKRIEQIERDKNKIKNRLEAALAGGPR